MSKKTANKFFSAAIGLVVSARDIAEEVVSQAKEGLEDLVNKGEASRPAVDKIIANANRRGRELVRRAVEGAEAILEGEAKKAHSAVTREVNRLAKKVVKATAPPAKRKKATKKK